MFVAIVTHVKTLTVLSAVHCEFEWGEYEQCSETCGGGTKSRFPIITQHPQNGGMPCPPFVKMGRPETVPCNTDPCPGMQQFPSVTCNVQICEFTVPSLWVCHEWAIKATANLLKLIQQMLNNLTSSSELFIFYVYSYG